MEEKKSNIRLVKTGGRRVTKSTEEYGAQNGLPRARRETNVRERSGVSALEKKVRYQKKQKARRLRKQRRRAAAILIMTAALVIVLMFLTPIFNIRTVTVDGNVIVTAEQFQEKLKPLIGENLFRTGAGKISRELKTIPYINTVEVQKKMFPPAVKIAVTEYTPAATVKTGGKKLVINSELRALSDSEEPGQLPVITGFTLNEYRLGETAVSNNEEKDSIVSTALRTLESIGLLDRIVEINVNDTADITLNFDNRITLLCGSQFDLERKLRLFKETVTSNSLAENARGTMDLKQTGKAVYTPDIYSGSESEISSENSSKSKTDTDKTESDGDNAE